MNDEPTKVDPATLPVNPFLSPEEQADEAKQRADQHEREDAERRERARIDLLNRNPLAQELALAGHAHGALVVDMIDERSLTVVYGEPGTGKSFILVDLSAAISAGLNWWVDGVAGIDRWNAGPILYVAGEDAAGVSLRLDAWDIAHCVISEQEQEDIFSRAWSEAPAGVGPDQYAESQVEAAHEQRCVRHSVKLLWREVNLFTGTEIDYLVELVRLHKIRAVIFDSYRACTVGMNEDGAKDTAVVIGNVKRIQRAGAAVVIAHHTIRGGVREAGSPHLRASSDHMFSVTGTKVPGTETLDTTTLTNVRQKNRPNAQPITWRVVPEDATESATLRAVTSGRQAADETPRTASGQSAADDVFAAMLADGVPRGISQRECYRQFHEVRGGAWRTNDRSGLLAAWQRYRDYAARPVAH